MRISKLRVTAAALLALAAAGLMLPSGRLGAASLERDVVVAYTAATSALKRRDFTHAIPGLKLAADRGVFLAQYYLARLYAMPGQSFTNHARAFGMLRRLVAKNGNIDPYIENRAPFVARAELLLAYYYRHGVPELSVPPSPAIAKGYLEHAALRLGDTDAQFELGRVDLENPETIARGLDTLDNLAVTKHHAAAAAEIAQIYNQGRFADRVPYQALGYAMLAAKLANGAERLDIGDVYQTIYCQTSEAERIQARVYFEELQRSGLDDSDGQVRPLVQRQRPVDGVLDLAEVNALRECSNGEVVPEIGEPGSLPLAPGQAVRSADAAASNLKRGFSSPVGFISPPMGIGLNDLEEPRDITETGEPVDEEAGVAPSN